MPESIKKIVCFIIGVTFATFTYSQMPAADSTSIAGSDSLQADSQEAEMVYNKGVEWYEKKQLDSAIRNFNEAVRLEPSFNQALFNRAIVKMDLMDYAGAIDDLNAVLKEKNDSEAFFFRGQARYKLGDVEGARADYTSCISEDPAFYQALYYRGGTYFDDDDYSLAIADYTRAISLNNDYAYAYCDRGSAYWKTDEAEKAKEDFYKASLLNPKLSFVFNNLGGVKMQMEDYKSAIADFTAAIKVDPDNYKAFANRAAANYFLEHYETALEDSRNALDIREGYLPAIISRANAYFKLKDYAAATALYDKAIAGKPEEGILYFNRGIAREMLRDKEGACVDWQKALELGIEQAEEYLNNCNNNKH